MEATVRKGFQLKEAYESQSFYHKLAGFDKWLSEREAQLVSQNYCGIFTDFAFLKLLEDRLKDMELNLLERTENLKAIQLAAQNFKKNNHFDSVNILQKESALVERFNNLFELIQTHKQNLENGFKRINTYTQTITSPQHLKLVEEFQYNHPYFKIVEFKLIGLEFDGGDLFNKNLISLLIKILK